MKTNDVFRAIVLAALLGAVGVAEARSSDMIELGRDMVSTASKPLSVAAVHQAILAGATVHGWRPVADQPGVVTLQVDNGPQQAVVDVAYDAQGWQITYKSSVNLNYQHIDQKTLIHAKYNRWIEYLNADIRRAAADAQAQLN